jgi:hypothetical protein
VLISRLHNNPDVRDSVSCYFGVPSVTTDFGCTFSGVTALVDGTCLINVDVCIIYIIKNITMNMAAIFPRLIERIKPCISS